MPRIIINIYTILHAMVNCCNIPGFFIHNFAFSLERYSCKMRAIPPTKRIIPTNILTISDKMPGMKHAVIPRIAVAMPIMMSSNDLRRSPNGRLPIVTIWKETITKKSPYVLSGVYGKAPVWILNRSKPNINVNTPIISRITTSK